MDLNTFSPYIRVATPALLLSPCIIYPRVLLDYELIYIESGKCSVTYEDKEFVAEQNDVVFIRPNITHKIELFPEINLSQPHIHFDITHRPQSEIIPISFKDIDKMSIEEREWIHKDYFSSYGCSPLLDIQNKTEFLELFKKIDYVRENLDKLETPCVAYQSQLDEMVSPKSIDILKKESKIEVKTLEKSTHFYYDPDETEYLKQEFMSFMFSK